MGLTLTKKSAASSERWQCTAQPIYAYLRHCLFCILFIVICMILWLILLHIVRIPAVRDKIFPLLLGCIVATLGYQWRERSKWFLRVPLMVPMLCIPLIQPPSADIRYYRTEWLTAVYLYVGVVSFSTFSVHGSTRRVLSDGLAN